MRITRISHPDVWKWNDSLKDSPVLFVDVPEADFRLHRNTTKNHFPHLNEQQQDSVALHMALTHPGSHDAPNLEAHRVSLLPITDASIQSEPKKPNFILRNSETIIVGLLVIIACLLLALVAHAEPNEPFNVAAHTYRLPQNVFYPPVRWQNAGILLGIPFTVNCSTGVTCSQAGSILTIIASGSGGTCAPLGAANNLLYDATGGACGDLGSLGTTTTVLHGNAAGLPSFAAIVSADLNITTTTCTNQFLAAISATAIGTCTTDTLASAQHANQGTTVTVLHGNGAGNPSFGAVALATDVSGQLPIAAVGSAGLSGTSPIAISAAGAISCSTCNTSTATVSSIATTSPITGGTITTTGTIACATCLVATVNPTAGLLRVAGSTQTATGAELSGDSTTSGSNAVTVVKVNGISYSATAAAHSVEVITSANTTATAKVVPDCTDTGGNHINYTQSTDAFSCGTSDLHAGTVTSIATTSPITGGTITATGTIACATCTVTIANGTSALATGAITSATCATVVTTSATGTATTDNIMADFNADPTGVTGYAASASGMLTIIKYPTANNVNFKVCNNTSGSITPGAITLNWRVVR